MGARYRIDVGEAEALIRERMPHFEPVYVPVTEASGEILRQPLSAERDQPPFDRVTMDGIAIRHAALATNTRTFLVRGTQAAGAPTLTLQNLNDCVEIMTGAKLPEGADTIIPIERLTHADGQATLEAGYTPTQGQFIHSRASDHSQGAQLLSAGIEIGPPETAVLTICGQREVRVTRRPRIAVISTGDELIPVGKPIADFQIRSSNGLAIAAALEKRGYQNNHQAHLPDNPDQLLAEIDNLHRSSDVLILSGGVSMGKYDYVPRIMEKLNVELIFHKILQRPGLPMWFGISPDDKPVFALPGNPVSSLVCLVRYVLPALRHAAGAIIEGQPTARLAESLTFKPDLTCFMPVRLERQNTNETVAALKPTNTSGDFISLAGTDGFVELTRGCDEYAANHVVPFFSW